MITPAHLWIGLGAAFVVGVLYASRVWERIPPLDRVAGRSRIRRYLADPVPAHIWAAKGGFTDGVLKGFAVTQFRFEPPLDRDQLLSSWRSQSEDSVLRVLLLLPFAKHLTSVALYSPYPLRRGFSDVLLLVDHDRGAAVLYKAFCAPLWGEG